MGLFPSRHTSRIGLDISENAIRLLQLEKNRSHLSVKAAAEWNLPEEIREENRQGYRWYHYCVQTIRRMIQENGFKGRAVRVSFSFDQLEYALLQIDSSIVQDMGQVVFSQAREQFGFEEHYGTVDYWESGEVGNASDSCRQYIAFGASDYILQNTILMLEDMHLRCAGIEPMPCALFRSVCHGWPERDFGRSMLIVHIGLDYSAVLTGRGSFMTGIRRVDYGSQDFNDNRPHPFDYLVNPKEELVKKIVDCRDYHQAIFQAEPPETLILTGVAVKTEFQEYLQQKTGCSVNSDPLFAGLEVTNAKTAGDRVFEANGWAVGLGLCLKDYISDKMAVG